ncbi:centromere-associated protein E-like [Chaetodon trifascialis]|uniref:centromere-associated protein E-like n=1 Tax=Chaetodon trifascialis TaxID=109706 RepID=UPI003995F6AA
MKLSFTTLSTIAIQAGQSQIVVSVLKSGSVVHLQLVQVHPGLCEIGSNQEENQTLIQEQQQLMEKLKKHEREVLAVVEKSRQAEQRRRRDEGTAEKRRNKKQKEEEEVHKSMEASLNEGWSLLLHLLQRRQEVLMLAAEFYRRALEFAVCIDRAEELQIRPDGDRRTEVQLTYDSMRRDLLGKSMQVLTSSNVLLQKLRHLQRTEALQRRGGVLQGEEEEEESSQCSRGMALRLEELVEMLQDRRRRADQAVRLRLRQVEDDILLHEKEQESRQAGSEDWSLTMDKILDQNLQSGSASAESTDLESESRTKETRDLQIGSRSDVKPGSRLDLKCGSTSEETRDFQSGSNAKLQPGFRLDLKPGPKPEETTNLQSGSKLDLKSGSRSDLRLDSKSEETTDPPPGSRLDQAPGSISDMQPESGLDVKPESRSDLQPGFRLEFKTGSRLEEIRNLQSGFKLNLKAGSRSDLQLYSKSRETTDLPPGSRSDQVPGSRSDMQQDSGLDVKPESGSEPTSNMAPGSRLDLNPESGSDLNPVSRLDLQPGFRLEFKTGSRLEEIRNLQTGFKLNVKAGSSSDLQLDSKSEDTTGLLPGSRSDMQPESVSDLKPESISEPIKDMTPGSRSNLNPESGADLKIESRSDLQPGFRFKFKTGSRLEEIRNLQSGFKLDLKAGSASDLQSDSKSEEARILQPRSSFSQMPGSRSDMHSESRLDVKPEFKSEPVKDMSTGSSSEETRNLKSGPRSDLKPESRSEESKDLQPESRSDLQSGSRSTETKEFLPRFRSDVHPESRLDLKSGSRSEQCRAVDSGFRSDESSNLQSGESRSDEKPESKSDLKSGSGSEQTRDLWLEPRSQETTDLHPRASSEERREMNSGFRSETNELPLESTQDVQPGSRSKETRGSRSEAESDVSLSELSRKQDQTRQQKAAAANTTSGLVAGQESMLGNGTQCGEDHTRLTNQKQQLLSSCEHLVEKIWSWVQQGSSLLSNSSEAGQQLFEAEETLNTHLQLHTQAEAAGQDAENMTQILDQIRALHTDMTSRTSPLPPSEPSRRLSPLKALTEQLKRGSLGRPSTARPGPPAADPNASLSPELAGQVDLVLKELHSLNRKINSNLQLLQPYVTFLRTAQQVDEEMEKLKEIYMRRPDEEEEEQKQAEGEAVGANTSSRPPVKKKQVDTCWQATLQKFLTAQELGNTYAHAVSMASGASLNLQSALAVVQQTLEQLSRNKQEVNELQSQQQIQIQQQQEYCRKYQERLLKSLQDLNSVSELLDSCTMMDLGSELQTSKLLEHFSQARPHFKQLDAEVENMEESWGTLRAVQNSLEEQELKGGAVKEEDLSELLKLQKTMKDKIHQSESILNLTSSFHLTSQQLEALLQSDPVGPLTGSTGLCGSSEAELSRHREDQQQIQSLFKTASTLKTDICTAINHSGWTCFRVEQLEARLRSLDSLCVSWLNEAAQREEKRSRELLTGRLNDDIIQLRDSFKELKKRFSNLKFNYLKRNDRTRNTKAVRNQLQQVELYEEKLQALRKRLQGVTARLGSEVKDGGVAREAEDAINELQRQMGDFERSVSDHQRTLEMTRKLQQAMEEYQFWCEEASATIARVGKFSSECRSTEAVAVLHQQFEKFVWPTVPQQEERISQIAELAVRLHGVEEGQRYIEKTVSKHSEMVESIRQLSDGLMELEAKLKLEKLKKQQNDGKKDKEEEGKRRKDSETEEKDKDKEKKLKEKRKLKKKEQTDNRSSQEAADMHELKETGHTPELTTEHDGKEVPVKRPTAANRKPPLQKSRSQDSDTQTESSRQQLYSEKFTSSFCSTHTFSLSCSPVEVNRRIHTIHSQLQPVSTEPQATPPASVIGPLFSDIQREFQRKESQETGQQGVVASCGSNTTALQDASVGGLLEAELQQQEVMTEDSLSNDEYECASPDDISLPSLAETPESNMVQSDVEEGFCFSSHSIHISQYSHQCHAQSEHSGTGTGAVQQQTEYSQTESCPTPPTSLHSTTRLRSESSSLVQSPLTVPATSMPTSTLCSILRTGEINTASDLSLGTPELRLPSGSKPVHQNSTPDSCSNNDNDVAEKRSPSQTEPLLKEHNSQCKQPQRTGTQGKISLNVASKARSPLPQTDLIPQTAELSHSPNLPESSYCSPPFNGPDPEVHKDLALPHDTRFLKCSTTFPQTITVIRTETSPVSKPQRNSITNTSTCTSTQQTLYFQSSRSDSHHTLPQVSSSLSSPQESPLSQSEAQPQMDSIPQARGFAQSPSLTDSVPHKHKTQSYATCPKTSSTIPQDSNPSRSYLNSRRGLGQDVPSTQTIKETPSVSMPQISRLTTGITVTQKNIYCQSSPPDLQSVPHASNNLRAQQGNPLSQGHGGLPEVHAPISPEPNSFSGISISSSTITSSNRFNSKQSLQTVYCHESLTSTCTQQCVHDPGMTPSSSAKPTAPPQPESQTQALAQKANLHVTPHSSPPHLLTPDQDPNICQPMTIREEIRLTPQIQGPPLPAPPHPQAESLPQGKASKPGPPCFTRPLSRATVMEGSPVTLEVEVVGQPEPKLTWFKDGEVSGTGPGRTLACEDRRHFLFVPEASDSNVGFYEVQAANHHDVQQPAGNSCSSGDDWLLIEVFDIISADWQTFFGTLCFLLWLLYLIVL